MDWKIGKSAGRCSGCDKEFAVGEDFYSALYDRGAEFERRDFCGPCWRDARGGEGGAQGGGKASPAEGPFSFWRRAVEERPRRRGVDLELVRQVFDRLEGDEDATRLKIRYFLSLILMRKRALRYLRAESDGDVEYMVVGVPKPKAEYRIRNPNLTRGEMADVREELENLLDMELGEPGAGAEAEEAAQEGNRRGAAPPSGGSGSDFSE